MADFIRHKPYTGTSATNWEVAIAADNGAPSAVGDANVTFAPVSGVSSAVNRIGPESVMIKGRFTGAGAAAADITVILWLWDADAEQWHACNAVPIEAVVSLTAGHVAVVDTDPNARLGYLEVQGLDGDEDAVLMVVKRS